MRTGNRESAEKYQSGDGSSEQLCLVSGVSELRKQSALGGLNPGRCEQGENQEQDTGKAEPAETGRSEEMSEEEQADNRNQGR
jgi:hypothetical protein